MIENIARFVHTCALVFRHKVRKWWPSAPPPDWVIVNAFAFSEDVPPPHKEFADITREFREGVHREALDDLGWTRWKIEVRYKCRDKKFRAVTRHDEEDISFPPCPIESVQKRGRLHSPEGMLVSAVLYDAVGGRPLDLTGRLRKYEGVLQDFGKKRLLCHDLFPFDDFEFNALEYGKLMVFRISCTRGIDVKTFDFAKNEAIRE